MKYSYNKRSDNFHIHTVHLDIIKVIYSPTNVQVIVLNYYYYRYSALGPVWAETRA
jgi:hypothetical protein